MLPILSSWSAFTERPVAPSPAASLISLLLPEASLPPLRVAVTHFVLSSYERALRLLTSFPILGLIRRRMKPGLYGSSWKAFASTHPVILFPREALFACLPFLLGTCLPLLWSPSFPLHAPALILLSRQGAALPHLDSLSAHDLDRWLCFFPFWQRRLWRTCQLLSL